MTTTNNAVNTNLSGQTGTGPFVGSTSPTITTPEIVTSINDSNGNIAIHFTPALSAVNYIEISNNTTGNAPVIGSAGADSNIAFQLSNKNSHFDFIDSTKTVGTLIRWYNAAITNWTGLKVDSAQATSIDLTLPGADGTALAPLVTDGSGKLSFLPGAWVDFSGTIGATGFTGALTVTYALYKKIGKTVFINIYLLGTSNATTFTITGLPFAAAHTGVPIPFCVGLDNNVNTICSGQITGTTLTLYNTILSLAAGWTLQV